MKKKITSILLCFSIIASFMPATIITAQAETGASIRDIGTKITYNTENSKLIITSDQTYENAKLLIAEYSSDGVLVGVTPNTVSIEAQKPYEMEYTPNASYTTKVMLWNDWGEMIPLAEAQEYKDAQVTSLGGNSTGAVVLNVQGTGNEAEPQIEYTAVENTDEMRTVAAVDASLADGETLDGTAEIRIKYDADKGLDATNLLPGYFNEETQEWETVPYMLDEENHEAIIITDHFSKYGLFEVQSSGTPKAFAKPLEAAKLAQLKPETAESILNKFDVEMPQLDEKTVENVLESLDGAFNGKLMGTGSNINSIVSGGGAVSEGFIGGVGKQFTILAVVGAAISVVNNTYKRGLTDTETLKAVTKAGIGAGVAFASVPIQLAYVGISMAQMAYDHVQEKELTAKHDSLKVIFEFYKKQQGKRSLADWKRIIDSFYEKYYVNELNSTTDNAEERYNKFYNSVHNVIRGYAYQFLNDYVNGDLDDMYLNVPLYTPETASIAEDLCNNYEAQIYESLSALFLQYSRRAYSDAVKKLEAECEKERQELNKEITLNFYEYGTTGLAKNYYVRFFDKKSDKWRADFDENGKAQLKFTYLSYLQMDSPQDITVFSKETDRAVGTINFPAGSLKPGEESSIPFDAENVSLTVNIHEVKQKSTDNYMFAGMYGRLTPIFSDANIADYAFDLDSKGCASLTFNIEKYYNDGAPSRLEIFDENDKVIYQTPFDISMREIALDGENYSVDIECEDEISTEHYSGKKAEVAYFKSGDTTPYKVDDGIIGSDGKLTLMLNKSEYEWHNQNYAVLVYDEDGASVERSFDLEGVFGNGSYTTSVLLEWAEPEQHDDFEIAENMIVLKAGSSKSVTVKSGSIDSASSSDTTVATAARNGRISAKGSGEAFITFMDEWGSIQTVLVAVTEDGNYPPMQGYYSGTITSRHLVMPGIDTHDTGDGSSVIYYVEYYVNNDGFSRVVLNSRASTGTIYTSTYARIDNTGRLYLKSPHGDGYSEKAYLEGVSFGSFSSVNVVDNSNLYIKTRVHYVRTGLTGFPSDDE